MITAPQLLSWLEVFLGILAGESPKRKMWDGDQEEALRSVDLYHGLIRGSLYFYRKKRWSNVDRSQKLLEMKARYLRLMTECNEVGVGGRIHKGG